MSFRTLIEINHDQDLDVEELAALQAYRRTASTYDIERLSDMGIRVIAMRHHADDCRIPANTWGLTKASIEEASA